MTQTAAGRADGYTLDLGGWRGKGNFGGGLASGNGLTGLRILSIQPFKRLWGLWRVAKLILCNFVYCDFF
jgi:hypothetical protein